MVNEIRISCPHLHALLVPPDPMLVDSSP